MVGLGHIHFGTARRTNDFAILVASANLLATDFNALIGVISFAFEQTALGFGR